MSNTSIQLTVEQLNKMQPTEIVLNDKVRSRFIQIYETLWGEGTGEAAYEKESVYFNRILSDNESLRLNSTAFSIFTSFIDLAICGLSLEPGARALCYLQGRNYCIGTDANGTKKYEGRCTLTISGYGELVLRARCGQIKYADNPVLVYSEDQFSFADRDGRKCVDYVCNLPHASGHIVAAFLRIVRNDGSVDYAVMYEEDWLRLRDYSARNNRKWDKQQNKYVETPNSLYSSRNGGIDPGFLGAKLIKHAFKTYPKVRIGRSTELQSEQPDDTEKMDNDFYGVKDQTSQEPAPYGEQAPQANGYSVEPKDDDGAF